MEPDKIKVLIADDTVLYRRILTDVVESFPEARVTATAPNGRLALAKLQSAPADLLLLDVEMPEMSGLETLREVRRLHPDTSVVMISGESAGAASRTMEALSQGALEFLRKPEGTNPEESLTELKDRLRPLLRVVRTRMNLKAPAPKAPLPAPSPRPSIPAAGPPTRPTPPSPTFARVPPKPGRFDLVAIGVSTGGPNALTEVIPLLPADLGVPVLIVQHMPPLFTASLAEHLNRQARLPVHEAKEGEAILPGHVYLAPGGKHMVVRRSGEGGAPIIGLNENPPENSCRPSVDVLFRSLAAQYDGHLLAVIMTGMGNDGCEGVRAMKRKGCHCLTQSEDSCVVYGMPMAVDEAGLSDDQVHLSRLAARITHLVKPMVAHES